jgi:PPOX class probable F420-dependent enzyme
MAAISDPLVQTLLNGRYIATLATHNGDGSAHLTAVWYRFDGSNIYVATSTRTRKLRNVQERPRASLMIDSRDPRASFGATITADVTILEGEAAHATNLNIHQRYLTEKALADSRVGPVFAGFDDVTLQLRPTSVFAWDMRVIDRMFLAGAMAENPDYFLPPEC